MPDDMRTTGGPSGTTGDRPSRISVVVGPSTTSGWVPVPSSAGEGPSEGEMGEQVEKGPGVQQEEDQVDGLPVFPVRNIRGEPQSFRPSIPGRPSVIAHPGIPGHMREPRDDRSKSDSFVFAKDRDFDAENETQDPNWISDDYSETSPLFGSEFRQTEISNMGSNLVDKPPPNDNFRFTWIVFYLLGMTTLLPWNFFISVNDYWNYKFRDTSGGSPNTTLFKLVSSEEEESSGGGENTELQKQFTSYLAIASNIPNAIFVILNVFFGRSFRLNVRIIGALSCMSTLFIGVILMARIDSDDWQEWFLFSTLTIVVFLNICTAIFQGGIIGVAGKFPPNYIGGMMSGQALGGIFPSLVNILVIAIQVKEADIGFYCFIVAFVFVLLSLGLYCAVQTTPFFRHYAGTGSTNRVGDSNISEADTGSAVSLSTYGAVFKTSWRYQVSVFLNFATTLSVFPSIIVLIKSQYSADEDNTFAQTYFIPVTCFLLFNVGDYIGRTLASLIKQPSSSIFGQYIVLALSVARIGFIPLFMYCNAAPDSRTINVAFDKDADYYALMTVFSISNGYIGNICMMNGPKTVENDSYQEIVASMLVSILVLGIGLGSALSYPLVSVLT